MKIAPEQSVFEVVASNGVRVGIIKFPEMYAWNYADTTDESEAIKALDEMHKKYDFHNWRKGR